MGFFNVYEDRGRADAYAELEFPGTYSLAYRDLPQIITEHITGKRAVDFGCGTGRSTRFLKKMGFKTTGVDIAGEMINKARERDPGGDYCLVKNGSLRPLKDRSYDLIVSVFAFDNIPTMGKKVAIFREFWRLLDRKGRIVHLVSDPAIYTHEWASFTTRDFPENAYAKCGDKVKIILKDVQDKRPVEDILWTDEAYQEVFKRAGLEVLKKYAPLAKENEPYEWINETRIAPWIVYVLKKTARN